MRKPRLVWIMGLMLLGFAASCKQPHVNSVSRVAGLADGAVVETSYYPYKNEVDWGPGHFNCSQYNNVTQYYLAPNDKFPDPRIWSGDPCPGDGTSVPQCQSAQKTCGVKLKITCADNCKSDAQPVVVMITDVCPAMHPQNIMNHACQGNVPHFDLGKPVWDLLHNEDNNISVKYDLVDSSTPLGPTDGSAPSTSGDSSSSNQQSNSHGISNAAAMFGSGYGSGTSGSAHSSSSPPPSPSPSPSSSPASSGGNNGSNNGQWCDPNNSGFCAPYCTNGSNTGNNFGWQPELHGPNGGSCRVP